MQEFASSSPEDTKLLLGEESNCEGATWLQSTLRSALSEPTPVAKMLAWIGDQVPRRWPEPNPARRAALLMLMLASGRAREHAPLPFDRRLLDLMG